MPSIVQKKGPTGRLKNCNEWAQFEPKGSSRTAALCHGGVFEDDRYPMCPSIWDCKEATGRVERLTQIRNKDEGRPLVGSQLVGATMNTLVNRFEPFRSTLPSKKKEDAVVGSVVIPSEDLPEVMRTPHVAMSEMGGITPTFLPEKKEAIFSRLGKNIAQGMVGSTGWQVWAYARHVDMFK